MWYQLFLYIDIHSITPNDCSITSVHLEASSPSREPLQFKHRFCVGFVCWSFHQPSLRLGGSFSWWWPAESSGVCPHTWFCAIVICVISFWSYTSLTPEKRNCYSHFGHKVICSFNKVPWPPFIHGHNNSYYKKQHVIVCNYQISPQVTFMMCPFSVI